MKQNMKRYSVEGLIDGTQDLLVWTSYHVFGLLAAVVFSYQGSFLCCPHKMGLSTAFYQAESLFMGKSLIL